MKLVTFKQTRTGADTRLGALSCDGSMVIDLAAAAGEGGGAAFASMLGLIEAGPRALDEARSIAAQAEQRGNHLLPVTQVHLLAPIPLPPQIRDASVFETHVRQAPAGMRQLAAILQGQEPPALEPARSAPAIYVQQPIYYITNRFSVSGPDETITWPRYSKYMDFELEVAVIIGQGGRNISASQAGEHIFGYTIFNDFSARDAQLQEMQGMLGPAKGKSFDQGNAFGPCIVTRDEIGSIAELKVEARVNGEVWGQGDLSAMMHSFEAIIEHVSRDETLHAGEIIGSGTVGNCCGLEHGRFLQDGDLVELVVERIGILRNRVRTG